MPPPDVSKKREAEITSKLADKARAEVFL